MKRQRLVQQAYLPLLCFTFCVVVHPIRAADAPAAAPGAGAPASTADAEALASSVAPPQSKDEEVMQQITLLNQIPEGQLTDEADPGKSIVKSLRELDGPDYIVLRNLVGQAKVRSTLSPSARGVIASTISQRWDAFNLAGNLWLGALKSTDPTMRAKARQKLVCFIQTAHVPALIDLLSTPGANSQAYEVLQEVTGQTMPPDVKSWRAWWAQTHAQVDVVGIVLKDTQEQVAQHPIKPFDADRFWYAPDSLDNVSPTAAHLTDKENQKLQDWLLWIGQDVRSNVDQWTSVKPALDRLTHQQDPRVNDFLVNLATRPAYGNYASVVLAWRGNPDSLAVIQKAFDAQPTVGRALSRGSLGDKSALKDLLKMISRHSQPLSIALMDDNARSNVQVLHTVGEIPAEQAFELLSHHSFGFMAATTRDEKKKSLKEAERWLKENQKDLTLDRHRGYYTSPTPN